MAADWLLLDGSSLMFRAFFGIPVAAFKAPDGQPVNAVRGFLDMLARLVSDRKPKALVVGRGGALLGREGKPDRVVRSALSSPSGTGSWQLTGSCSTGRA